ncbi:YqaA family protein [Shewanella litoralis]|uniref:Membrane protein n=1 Tax=Shewanella litoralis TaxID=2282700 RepID=A0ABQ2R4Z6_9GAMM|nr:VTT domain-containing protein [Shewanella litoralis]GGQ14025.1 membrane protein [Shewanella litoralis]
MTSLWMMFSGAFLAATLLPGGSEVLLVALLNDTSTMWPELLLMATLGNTLGALTSYGLGRAGRMAKNPQDIQSKSHQTALVWVERYGIWSLLLSWLPLVGDVLCLLAGWLKWPLVASTLLIFVGKILRYSVIVFIFLSV